MYIIITYYRHSLVNWTGESIVVHYQLEIHIGKQEMGLHEDSN